eukprot:scaffold349377_cov26-Attheya_sp.AAC.1
MESKSGNDDAVVVDEKSRVVGRDCCVTPTTGATACTKVRRLVVDDMGTTKDAADLAAAKTMRLTLVMMPSRMMFL